MCDHSGTGRARVLLPNQVATQKESRDASLLLSSRYYTGVDVHLSFRFLSVAGQTKEPLTSTTISPLLAPTPTPSGVSSKASLDNPSHTFVTTCDQESLVLK